MTTRYEQHNFYFASNQIFNDLRSRTCDLTKADSLPASKAVRTKSPALITEDQNKDNLIQKFWEPERTFQLEAIGTSIGSNHYRVLLPALPGALSIFVLSAHQLL